MHAYDSSSLRQSGMTHLENKHQPRAPSLTMFFASYAEFMMQIMITTSDFALCRPSACPSCCPVAPCRRCRNPCWALPYAALAPPGSAQSDWKCHLIMQRPPQARRCSRWNAPVCPHVREPEMRKVPNFRFLWVKLSIFLRGAQGARHGGCEAQALRPSRRLRETVFLRASW